MSIFDCCQLSKKPECTPQPSHLSGRPSGGYGSYFCLVSERSAMALAIEYVPRKATIIRGAAGGCDTAT